MKSMIPNQFKILHSDIIMYCQILENDIKLIYSFRCKGEVIKIRECIDKNTLGQTLKKLKALDNLNRDLYISADDYNFLSQMTQKRNYWCHKCYIDFVYVKNFLSSDEYGKVFNKLKCDHDKLENVYKNVGKLKLKLKR